MRKGLMLSVLSHYFQNEKKLMPYFTQPSEKSNHICPFIDCIKRLKYTIYCRDIFFVFGIFMMIYNRKLMYVRYKLSLMIINI